MFKRFFALLLSAAAMFCFISCDDNETDYDEDDFTFRPIVTNKRETEGQTETSAPEETEPPEAGEYDPESGIYENSLYRFIFRNDGSWHVADRAELAEIQNLNVDEMTDEVFETLMQKYGSAMIFYCRSENGEKNVNITLNDMRFNDGLILSEEEFLGNSEDLTVWELEHMGLTDVEIEVTDVRIAGVFHRAFAISCDRNGEDFYELQLAIRSGKYMAAFTFVSLGEPVGDDMLSMFEEPESAE